MQTTAERGYMSETGNGRFIGGEIVQDKFVEPRITEYLFHKATVNHRPICGTFELSPLCNYNCKMCYVHQNEAQLREQGKTIRPPEFWLELARQAKEEGVLYLLLTGGEPFLYKGFWELYEGLAKMGFVISINSNGSLIDETVVERLKENPPARINITLYGASDETYEKICGVKNGYTRTTRAIELLREAGISVKLNCSLTPSNAGDLEKVIRFAEEKELIVEVATYMFPPIRLDEEMKGKNHRFTPQEMAHYDMCRIKYQRGEEMFQQYRNNIAEGIVPLPDNDNHCKGQEGGKIRCRAGRAIFWTTWEGNITPCGMMPIPSVSLEDKTFKEAWEQLAEETDKIRLAPECRDCENQKICHVCAGMTYGENADFTAKPEYLCQYVKALKKECEEYKHNEKEQEGKQ